MPKRVSSERFLKSRREVSSICPPVDLITGYSVGLQSQQCIRKNICNCCRGTFYPDISNLVNSLIFIFLYVSLKGVTPILNANKIFGDSRNVDRTNFLWRYADAKLN